MADIGVERKSPTIWPWILGLILVAALIWALTEFLGGDEQEATVEGPASATAVDTTAPR